jgi:YkoY family integral membrane protein
MEAESIPSLSPLIEAADQWGEWLLLLPLLVALEAVLSADNAIALAAISRRLEEPAAQGRALNLGLGLALLFRLLLIALARWVLDFWPLQLLAAGYLLWLCASNLLPLLQAEAAEAEADASVAGAGDLGSSPQGGPHRPHDRGLGAVVLTLALTDLAFSLDSVAAAVAVSDNLVLVMAGGAIGVLALRLTSALFIRWLAVFDHLETAGYLAVGLVGIRLVLRVVLPELVPPEWALLALVVLLFGWGFSRRSEPANPVPIDVQP